MPSWLFRVLMNVWPPFRGAGIKVRFVAPDFSEVDVELAASRFKRNYVGTHFGGSLYAMTDPFFMLMLLHRLGKDYWVWDLKASIEYLTAESGPVRAQFLMPTAEVERVRALAANGDKVTPEYVVDVCDQHGTVVARVQRTLYVRLKKNKRPVKTDPNRPLSL